MGTGTWYPGGKFSSISTYELNESPTDHHRHKLFSLLYSREYHNSRERVPVFIIYLLYKLSSLDNIHQNQNQRGIFQSFKRKYLNTQRLKMISKSLFAGIAVLFAVSCKAFSFQPIGVPSSLCYNLHNTKNAFFHMQQLQHSQRHKFSHLKMSEDASSKKRSDLPMLLDPGTKGGHSFYLWFFSLFPLSYMKLQPLD
jgi:hypothetical protein